MKVKRTELIKLKNGIEACGNLTGGKFVYAINKNKRLIEQEENTCKNILKEKKEYTEYEVKRKEICEKYCEKDKNNQPVIVNRKYVGLDTNKEFKTEMGILTTKYKEAIEVRRKQIMDYNEIMVGETEINLHVVKKQDVPMGTITGSQYDGVFIMIDDKPTT